MYIKNENDLIYTLLIIVSLKKALNIGVKFFL